MLIIFYTDLNTVLFDLAASLKRQQICRVSQLTMCRPLHPENDDDSVFEYPPYRYAFLVTYLWMRILEACDVEMSENYLDNMMLLCCPCHVVTCIPGAMIGCAEYGIRDLHGCCVRYSWTDKCPKRAPQTSEIQVKKTSVQVAPATQEMVEQ